MKRKQYKEITEEYLQELRFKDIVGTITDDEIKLLVSRNIPCFAAKTVDLSTITTEKDKEKIKQWLKLI